MHYCWKEPSAYPLTQGTISNPERFSMFSVVFQHRIPKCISLILILCFEQTKVHEYFSVLLRSKVVFVRFSESDNFRFKKLSEFHMAIFHYSYLSLELSIPCFLPDSHSRTVCLGLRGSMNSCLTKERTGIPFPPPCSTLLSSHVSHYFLTLGVTPLIFVLLFFF